MIIILIIGIVLWAIMSSKSNDNNNNYCDNSNSYHEQFNQYNISNDNAINIDNSKQTEFQRQLRENSRIPEQINDEKISKEIEQSKKSANLDYTILKQEILKQAECGNYTVCNGYKTITYDYKYRYRPSFIGRKIENVYINQTLLKPTGEFANKLTMFIVNQNYYNNYISEINRLAKEDNIIITPLMINKNNSNEIHSLPFSVQGFCVCDSDYEFILRCSIQY